MIDVNQQTSRNTLLVFCSLFSSLTTHVEHGNLLITVQTIIIIHSTDRFDGQFKVWMSNYSTLPICVRTEVFELVSICSSILTTFHFIVCLVLLTFSASTLSSMLVVDQCLGHLLCQAFSKHKSGGWGSRIHSLQTYRPFS